MVVSTSTASGKSLCYLLPILEALAADRGACALLMFPTKALAQDQLRATRELCGLAFGADAPSVEIYDGDTDKVGWWPGCGGGEAPMGCGAPCAGCCHALVTAVRAEATAAVELLTEPLLWQ